jgi:hypothetical protein
MKIDWEHIYLLGWYSPDGKRNLTPWQGKRPWIDVVVIDATDDDMKHIMWSSPLHRQFDLVSVPKFAYPKDYARAKNGLWAFGWYLEEGVNRPPMRELIDEWAWYYKLKGTQ